jgi:hypothetical protein
LEFSAFVGLIHKEFVAMHGHTIVTKNDGSFMGDRGAEWVVKNVSLFS